MTARRYQHTRAKTPDTIRGDDWRDRARCVGSEHIFGDAVEHPNDAANNQAAKAICADCPVRAICLRVMDPICEYGIIGGLTEQERKALRLGQHINPEPAPQQPLPFACPECTNRSISWRGIAQHYAVVHSAYTGRCIRGHDYQPGSGRCEKCRKHTSAASERARYQRRKEHLGEAS